MKFGLYTAILGNMPFEQVVDTAFEMGFKCLEVEMCIRDSGNA